MDTLRNDLRFALRALLRSPGFALAAIATLGLGIGATSLVFSLISGIMMRPFPYEQPGRLIGLLEMDRDGRSAAISYPNFLDYRAGMRSLSGMGAYSVQPITLSGALTPEQISGAAITHGLFELLGMRPVLGRTFLPEEDMPGGEPVVLIGHGLWQRVFSGSRDAIGRTLTVNGEPHTVVGVMPPDFRFPEISDVWRPLRADPALGRGDRYLSVIGRLAPSATMEQAAAEAEGIRARLEQEYPNFNRERRVQVGGLQELNVRGLRPVLMLLFAAVGFVLLIACANVASLLLSRAASRDREMAIRASLGAGRFRLVRQLLTESALLGMAGAVLGVLLSWWWLDLVLAAIPGPFPFWLRIAIDARVLVFTVLVALVTAFLFGLAPSLQASRTDLQSTLKVGRGTVGSVRKQRLRSVLIVGQLALAMVLLVTGLLMVRSYLSMQQVNPGFRIENVVAVDLTLLGPRYDDANTRAVFYDRLLQRVRAQPGIERAAAISAVPIYGANHTSSFTVEGRTASDPAAARHAHNTVVSPEYFETMDIPLLRGRSFRISDGAQSERVAIINQRLAELFFEGEDPVGRRVAWGTGGDPEWMTIVGVSSNINQRDVNQTVVEPEIHRPIAQSPERRMSLVVRTAGSPQTLLPVLRREVAALDRDIPLFNLVTMREVVRLAVSDTRLFGSMFAAFAVAALLLAAIGLYGVVAYSVAQRRQEIGVRIALGAQPRIVARMVLGHGIRLALLGVITGTAGALAMARAMGSLLYGVRPADPITFTIVPLLLAAVAVLASYIPTRRALHIDPMTALRQD
jgi:putative ABC transport system permease protein